MARYTVTLDVFTDTPESSIDVVVRELEGALENWFDSPLSVYEVQDVSYRGPEVVKE